MARATTSVRMGPVSILTLVIVLCLAVMAVLSITTANASLALSERQASFVGDDYANETVGQAFYAELDNALAPVRAGGGDAEAGAAAVAAQLDELIARAGDASTASTSPIGADAPALSAAIDGTAVTAHVESASGRCLDMTFAITDDARVSVLSWKATTLWTEDTTDVLWTGGRP